VSATAPPRAARARRLRGPGGPAGPLVLGLETGGDELSIALWRLPAAPGAAPDAWRLLDETTAHRGHRHADSVLLMVEAALWRQGLGLEDLALVAVGRGPGGFTGVRVGLATGLGLGLGAGIPVWPVPSLAAHALHAAGRPGLIVPLLDARRGEVYGAAYRVPRYGVVDVVLAPRVASSAAVLAAAQALAAPEEPLVVFGSGAKAYAIGTDVPPCWHRAAARHIAALGALAWEAAGRDPRAAPPVDPHYLRPSDAEIAQAPTRESP